jgi:hypothetical protein
MRVPADYSHNQVWEKSDKSTDYNKTPEKLDKWLTGYCGMLADLAFSP